MTVKEAAVRWGVSEWRVRSWCEKGYLIGAIRRGRYWLIPEEAKRPYLSRKKKFARPYEKSDYVLKAIGSGLFLDFRLLALSPEEFAERTDMLIDDGLVERTGTGGQLTIAGEERLRRLEEASRREKREKITAAAALAGPALTVLSMVA